MKKVFALRLARSGLDGSVDELIRMVEQKWPYKESDMKVGLKALGKTGKTEAQEYLKKISAPDKKDIFTPFSYSIIKASIKELESTCKQNSFKD